MLSDRLRMKIRFSEKCNPGWLSSAHFSNLQSNSCWSSFVRFVNHQLWLGALVAYAEQSKSNSNLGLCRLVSCSSGLSPKLMFYRLMGVRRR